ncbi:putative metabolite transporter [Mycena rebaudengoi]|nr:putative metabolite transporter [Mycena rebaudengoi]
MSKQPLKERLKGVSLIFACGTALFADGYGNGIIGSVNTLLKRIYGTEAFSESYSTTLNSATFAGTIFGMLTFGYISDKVGRKFGMMTAAGMVAFFSALSSASSGANHNVHGLIAMLVVCRFFLGIGIGAEYPCGSVSASEQTEGPSIAKNAQHRWFALATNSMIDFAFVVSAFVPLVMFWIFGPNHLRAAWRLSLGLGFFPAIAVLAWRWTMEEPQLYKKSAMKSVKIPYGLVLRRYGVRLAAISVTWFIYDFIVYFGIYSSTVVDTITGGDSSLTTVFGWNVVINLFYMPGTIVGAFVVDYLGPKNTMIIGLLCQAFFGFLMSGLYSKLKDNIAAFAVLYGIFLCFGEFGPGNNLGLLASKSSPTAVRGQFYGTAAAVGKVGAFVGTWAFPPMIESFKKINPDSGNTGPFWVGSGTSRYHDGASLILPISLGLAILSALITYFFIKPLDHDGMAKEDAAFREYLEQHGFDTSGMGLGELETQTSSVPGELDEKDEKVAV